MGTFSLTQKIGVRGVIMVVAALGVIYAVLSLLAPSNTTLARYGVNAVQFSLLRVSILIPLLLIWLAAGFASARFFRYASLIEGSPESKGFVAVCRGIRLLVLVLILPAFIRLIAAFNPENFAVERVVAIVATYVTIMLYGLAFWELWRGVRALNVTFGLTKAPKGLYATITAVLALLSVLYVYAVFNNPFRTVSTDSLVKPVYYLPDALILITIIIPYILIWLFGSLAIINLRIFYREVPGRVYRRAFKATSYGLSAVIILLVILQFLTQASGFFGHASLQITLFAVYVLLLIIAVAYLFIARGARALAAMEEV